MFQDLRKRTNRKALALLAIFAIALSGTGLASLAILVDQATVTVTASITTIDLRANGTKSASFEIGQVVPGDVRYLPINLTNSGTGYVTVSSLTGILQGSQATTGSLVKFYQNVPAAICDAAHVNLSDPGNTNGDGSAANAPFSGTIQIDAAGTKSYCVIFRIGATGATYTDGLGINLVWEFNGTHP